MLDNFISLERPINDNTVNETIFFYSYFFMLPIIIAII